jgi:heme d1 biosynthesis radical SAM protein NirJ
MFRISQYLRELHEPTPMGPKRNPPGPVVIWNLVRRCNLTCKHCYSISTDIDFPGELSTQQIFKVMDDLKQFHVPVLILSGGEPLMRSDIFEISQRAKEMGFYTALSTNGTLIDENNIDQIAAMGYDYLGISIDGIRETHDEFRQKKGAYDASMKAIRLCHNAGIKVGMRFSITQGNAHELPTLLATMDEKGVDKFYLSHLNYGGRGKRHSKNDAVHKITREAMDLLFDTCWEDIQAGRSREFVTGNNDADGVYLLQWIKRKFPEQYDHMRAKLAQWGGNSSGVNVSNIDNLGNVHPDTFWWDYNLGNVKERPFSEIWQDTSDPLMAGFKQSPRSLRGRCGVCPFLDVCGGNTRVRAFTTTGDPWWEDPACYLSDQELGLSTEDYQDSKPIPLALKLRKIRIAS